MDMRDIAKLAGVSKATVSRVINNSQNVSPELRTRVEVVLKETGYTPNLLAQELVTKKTKLIGVILPRIGIDTFSYITEGITDKLNEEGYNILLASSSGSKNDEFKYFNIFQKKHVDGIIFFPTEITESHIKLINQISIPVVIMGQQNSKINVPYVTYDDFNASKEIVSYLISAGHDKIAYIGLSEDKATIGGLRKEGYITALKEHNINVNSEYLSIGDFQISSGYKAMKNIMDNSKVIPTAVFAVIDRLAFGAIQYLREQGYKVPEDISVVGIDDMEVSSIFEPTLTTIHFNYYESGISASKAILEKLQNADIENKSIVMGYELKIRNSTKNIKNH